MLECTLEKDRDICWEEALEAEPVPCVSVEANEPLYILYTSGNNLISTNSFQSNYEKKCLFGNRCSLIVRMF